MDEPSPITTTTTDPLTNQFGSLNDLAHELASLEDLATRGSWRSILDKVARARSLNLLTNPNDHLIYLSYNVLALSKLRRFTDAATELDTLDDFNSHYYKYETYPQLYKNRSGSMIPFSLRFIHAQLPIKLGNRLEGLDRFYLLLNFIRQKIKEKELNELHDSLQIWKKRENFVLNSLIGHHLGDKEFNLCLDLIKDSINRDYLDPVLVSKLGYIQLQIGDIEGAKASFQRVETMVNDGQRNLVNRNKALVYLAGKDYVSAVREYEECIERDETDIVAVNNKALCLMYLRDLTASIKVLENALERVPNMALDETLVTNLCSMYELAYVNHSEVKRTLSNWIVHVAPDDFDASCTRV